MTRFRKLTAAAIFLATAMSFTIPLVSLTPAGAVGPITWAQVGADIDGEALSDNSGTSVAFSADGSRVAIGAPLNDGAGGAAGHVRVYDFDGKAWVQAGGDIDGEAADDRSGFSVALSADGSRVAIGAPLNDGAGRAAGHVRVHDFDGKAWVQAGGDIDGEAAGDRSGFSVALSADGSRVAIGAKVNDGAGDAAGHVRVHDFDGTAWVQAGGDIDGEAAGDRSGWTVALSADGSRVAIGAPLNDGAGDAAGHVRVHDFDGTAWVQAGADIDGEAAGDRSGTSVALSADGSRVAIGAPLNDGAGGAAGHVRVHEFDGTAWVQAGADIDGEAIGDRSGTSVALSADGSRVAIGAIRNDGAGSNEGHVRVHDFDGTAWVQAGGDIDGEAAGDESGWSVALSADGSGVAVGARLNDGAGDAAGHVRVFEVPDTVPEVPTRVAAERRNETSAFVSWTPPADDGGSPLTTYIVTPYLDDVAQPPVEYPITFDFRRVVVTGLTTGELYTFTVTARNAVGDSTASERTSPAIIPATKPSAPTIGAVVAGDSQVTVSWTAPVFDGGLPVTGYVVTPYEIRGGIGKPVVFDGDTPTTQTITGLTNGSVYRFRVHAVNAIGGGPKSDYSDRATPTIGTDV